MTERDIFWYETCPKETIKQCSFDDDNKEFLSYSEGEVINFDKVKEEFVRPKNLREICSNDALFYNEDEDTYYFIEFKNGKIKSDTKKNIRTKIYDSYIIFLKYFGVEICDTKINYILVYNEDKNPKNVGNANLSGALASRSNNHIIRFGLNKFKGYIFEEMFTVSQSEFKEKFSDKWFCVS